MPPTNKRFSRINRRKVLQTVGVAGLGSGMLIGTTNADNEEREPVTPESMCDLELEVSEEPRNTYALISEQEIPNTSMGAYYTCDPNNSTANYYIGDDGYSLKAVSSSGGSNPSAAAISASYIDIYNAAPTQKADLTMEIDWEYRAQYGVVDATDPFSAGESTDTSEETDNERKGEVPIDDTVTPQNWAKVAWTIGTLALGAITGANAGVAGTVSVVKEQDDGTFPEDPDPEYQHEIFEYADNDGLDEKVVTDDGTLTVGGATGFLLEPKTHYRVLIATATSAQAYGLSYSRAGVGSDSDWGGDLGGEDIPGLTINSVECETEWVS
ncbi:hypothetical protein [Natrialba magadii]|nr:hypothetical protein [Natrialba magadii]